MINGLGGSHRVVRSLRFTKPKEIMGYCRSVDLTHAQKRLRWNGGPNQLTIRIIQCKMSFFPTQRTSIRQRIAFGTLQRIGFHMEGHGRQIPRFLGARLIVPIRCQRCQACCPHCYLRRRNHKVEKLSLSTCRLFVDCRRRRNSNRRQDGYDATASFALASVSQYSKLFFIFS